MAGQLHLDVERPRPTCADDETVSPAAPRPARLRLLLLPGPLLAAAALALVLTAAPPQPPRRLGGTAEGGEGGGASADTPGSGDFATLAKPGCLDAAEGELCHRLVAWVQEDGLRFYPDQYASLTAASSFAEVQAALHLRSPEYCPAPCLAPSVAQPPHPQTALVASGAAWQGCDGAQTSEVAHAACIVTIGGRLLAERLTYDGLKFDIPGGQTTGAEPATCTARREVWEETGYIVSPRELLAVVRNNVHIYRCHLLGGPVKGHDHEISWVGWFTQDDIRAKLSQGQWRFPEATRYLEWAR